MFPSGVVDARSDDYRRQVNARLHSSQDVRIDGGGTARLEDGRGAVGDLYEYASNGNVGLLWGYFC